MGHERESHQQPEKHSSSKSKNPISCVQDRSCDRIYNIALILLEQALKGLPDRARIHYNLGLIRQYLQAIVQAEEKLKAALAQRPIHRIIDRTHGSGTRFRRVRAPTSDELSQLTHIIAQRIAH